MGGAAGSYSDAERRAWAGPGPDPEKWAGLTLQSDIWIASDEGVPVGFAGLSRDQFDFLFVHPSVHRRGIGGLLHDKLVNRARSAGETRLTTFASHAARPFFEAYGWRAIATNRVQRRGVWLENTHMMRAIV